MTTRVQQWDFICEDCGVICSPARNGAVIFEEQRMPNGERYPVQMGALCEVCSAKAKLETETVSHA